MAALNVTDLNMPTLESPDANHPRSQDHSIGMDDSEKASAEDEENHSTSDTLIDPLDNNSDTNKSSPHLQHKTIELEHIKSLKGLIANDEMSIGKSVKNLFFSYFLIRNKATNISNTFSHPTTQFTFE